jgi:urease accessory protein
MKRNYSIFLVALAGVMLMPGLASAHIIPGTHHSVYDGFAHPFSGLDHLLAMFAVGLWASQCRGRAVWMIPLTFVSVMVLGGILGLTGAHLPGIEFGIALSVLVLGVLIATATRLKLGWGMTVAGLFALFHGYAHGAEMPAAVSALSFSVGFVLATLVLHAMGIAAGFYLAKQARAVRLAGAAIALCSICFFASLG